MTIVPRPRPDAGGKPTAPSRLPWLQDFYWDAIPTAVSTDRRLSFRGRLLYGVVAGLSKQDGWCRMGKPALAEMLGCSTDALSDDLTCLVTIGLLQVRRRTGDTTLYRPVPLSTVYDVTHMNFVKDLLRTARGDAGRKTKQDAVDFLSKVRARHKRECSACQRQERDNDARSRR